MKGHFHEIVTMDFGVDLMVSYFIGAILTLTFVVDKAVDTLGKRGAT